MNRRAGLMSRRSGSALAAIASVGTVITVSVVAACSAAGTQVTPVANQSSASSAAVKGADPVGPLFSRDGNQLGSHFCTASVVPSRSGDLLITAAHCVSGLNLTKPARVLFAPSYGNGRFPRGLWAVTRRFTDSRWAANQDPNDDVAFLVVRPVTGADGLVVPIPLLAPSATVRAFAGTDQLRFGAKLPVPIRAIGYPDGSDQRVTCSTRAVAFDSGSLHQVKFACAGFTDGTSGGPMISKFDPAKRTGAVIGVIGGYQQGGDSPSISYSSAFAGSIRALYQRASHAP
jgi:hypothetical protein